MLLSNAKEKNLRTILFKLNHEPKEINRYVETPKMLSLKNYQVSKNLSLVSEPLKYYCQTMYLSNLS